MPPPTLTVFERTNFFYGLLLDAERLQKDHAFFNGKRWLLNRLALGSGVLCGLGVRSVAGPPAAWFIDAGIAIDGLGREIVVAENFQFNPAQPTDNFGQPVGGPLAAGTVEICLAYSEVPTSPVPVLVPDCDGEGECAPSVIREGFVVIVREAKPAPLVDDCALPAFPVPPATGLHDAFVQRLKIACPKPPDDACVPIAGIDLAKNTVDIVTGRQVVYSNRLLYELIVCLAEHVANTATRVLQYVSGDGQSATASTALADPIVVQLVDQQNNPIKNEQVQFTVKTGGSVGAASVATAENGRASTTWTLGAAKGEQQVIATAKNTAFAVTFRATAA
jgi:hypothetical protein